MSDIIKGLAEKAKANLAAAQIAEFGYRSGPGIDITVRTTQPITGNRILIPVTKAGQAFVNKFFHTAIIPLSDMHKLEKLACEWGLSISTIWEVEEL